MHQKIHQKLDQYYVYYLYLLPMMFSNKTFHHIDLLIFKKKKEMLFIYSV